MNDLRTTGEITVNTSREEQRLKLVEKIQALQIELMKLEMALKALDEEAYSCGYCGSTKPLVDREEIWPGDTGYPVCPDCHGC